MMKKYGNKSGKSGVVAYEMGVDWIKVKFTNGIKYKYSYRNAGIDHVEEMKDLARKGEALSGYISKYVSNLYD